MDTTTGYKYLGIIIDSTGRPKHQAFNKVKKKILIQT